MSILYPSAAIKHQTRNTAVTRTKGICGNTLYERQVSLYLEGSKATLSSTNLIMFSFDAHLQNYQSYLKMLATTFYIISNRTASTTEALLSQCSLVSAGSMPITWQFTGILSKGILYFQLSNGHQITSLLQIECRHFLQKEWPHGRDIGLFSDWLKGKQHILQSKISTVSSV